jgi:hypothetical protein
MKHFLSLILILGYAFSSDYVKCGVPQIMKDGQFERHDRPSLDSTYDSPQNVFRIHYDETGVEAPLEGDENQNNIPDYVEMVGIMADSAFVKLVNEIGFNPHPNDGDGLYDIYISDNLAYNAYGLTWSEGNGVSFIEIENDYSENQFATHGYDAMKVTIVHEYFHAVQFGYSERVSGTGYDNRYFYEMSSTWIEDILVPEVNDYLNFTHGTSSGKFFSHPESDIEDTDGYSIALFGHSLTELFGDIVMLHMWERFEYLTNNYGNPEAFNAMEYVFENNYQPYNFMFFWTRFISLNLFNGIDTTFYYYEDQALINPINTDVESFNSEVEFSMNLGSHGATIKSLIWTGENTTWINTSYDNHEIINGVIARLNDNSITTALNMPIGPINYHGKIHYIFGVDSGSETVDLSLNFSYIPPVPSNFFVETYQDSVVLNWDSVSRPPSIYYWIYRNNEFVGGTTLTSFTDTDIEPSTVYEYKLLANNITTNSEFTETITIETWPNQNSINENEVHKVYPNPLNISNSQNLTAILDLKKDYEKIPVEWINLSGKRIYKSNIYNLIQGRQRVQIPKISGVYISSGIYFVRFRLSDSDILTQKVILTK